MTDYDLRLRHADGTSGGVTSLLGMRSVVLDLLGQCDVTYMGGHVARYPVAFCQQIVEAMHDKGMSDRIHEQTYP